MQPIRFSNEIRIEQIVRAREGILLWRLFFSLLARGAQGKKQRCDDEGPRMRFSADQMHYAYIYVYLRDACVRMGGTRK